MRIAAITVVLTTVAVAHAHGPSGSHESPQWCGEHLAMLADGGVLVDGTLVAVPIQQALVAWSPSCDQIAVAGEQAFLIDATKRTVRDLGDLPNSFRRAMRLDGPAPSIRWSPSGKRFAFVVANRTIWTLGLARFDVATGTGVLLNVTGDIKAFALVTDDTAVAAFRAQRSPDMQLVRVDDKTSTPLSKRAFKDARFSIAPLVLGLTTPTDELVLVDPTTGTDRVLANSIAYLQAMSDDGSHALVLHGTHPATIDTNGTLTDFAGDLTYGLIADEHTAWSANGTLTITRSKGWVIVPTGGRPRPWSPVRTGDVEHVSLSPDGKRIAFIVEVSELDKRKRTCDFETRTRADLFVAELAKPTRAKKIATVAHLHGCGVE